jgi:hypothetical protein
MENAPLQPQLPWRRLMPGTYAAETPSGHTYRVEKTDADWRVILLGPRGGREVLGEPTRIKWLGQCRAEQHYLHVLGAKAEAPKAAMPPREKVAAAAASLKAQAAAPKTAAAPKAPATPKAAPNSAARKDKSGEKPASRRHRRPPAAPPKAAPAGSPLPAETLAWQVSQKKGREFHVAEHKGGLFKILEVKGTEGFALFDEKADGVVHEIKCGSLDACKQTAASMFATKGKAPSKGEAASKGGKSEAPSKSEAASKGGKSEAASKGGKGEAPTKATGKRVNAPEAVEKPPQAAEETPGEGPCGCQHAEETQPEPKPEPEPKPAAKEQKAKILAGLESALRKMKPPKVAEA